MGTLNQLLLQFLLLPQPSLLVQLTDLLDTEDTDTELLSLPQLLPLPQLPTPLPQSLPTPSPLPQLPTLVPVLPTVLPGGNFVNPTNLQNLSIIINIHKNVFNCAKNRTSPFR